MSAALTHDTPEAAPRILRRRQVEEATGLPRSSLYAKIKKGEFPAQIRLGARSVGWTQASVSAWVAERIAATREAA